MGSAPIPDPSGAPGGGAAACVAELFERHGRMVYGLCRALLRDVHEAEDATQQAFLAAYRALLAGANVREAGAWLAAIARNECRARIAAGMRSPLPVADEDLAALAAPVDEAARRALAEALQRALAELPERQRQAVVLRYLYGLRYGEVATALGLSRPATEALLFRARRALRLRLRPAAGSTLALPLAVRDSLADVIPGFTAAAGSGAGAAAAAGGLLAKLVATPAGAKMATAAVAIGAVGAVGAVESERG
ncbi:MAG TPA: sigma-70 family RNA polymerase sigma factor, partial [Gaiellaceae bacterium]|nr:sigma-70 family RNA polymerase sigma factor [Gaiellaceae bacterium]